MNIELTKDQIEAIGWKKLEPYGVTEDGMRWAKSKTIDLSGLTKTRSEQLRELLYQHKKVKGILSRVAAVDNWLAVLGGALVRCKKLKDFDSLLKQYLKDAPKHWVYERQEDTEYWQPYYVSDITYHPAEHTQHKDIPARVVMTIHVEEMGCQNKYFHTFWAEDVLGKTASVALADKGYVVENPELFVAYEKHRLYYVEIHDKIGLQFEVVGTADTNVDEVGKRRRNYWERASTIRLDRDGVPARLVVDVRYEEDDDKEGSSHKPSGKFWGPERCDHEGSEDDDDNDIEPEDVDEDAPGEVVEVPLDPTLVCFDLRRHMRMKVWVHQMTRYQYQTDLASKLILPDVMRQMVDLLVSHKGGFKDIVGGKGSGAIMLCAGSPGTGKTLTSEIYSEAMQKPLYTVQCSQLGTDPKELEGQLRTCFARAQRWGAILLLDEADVYVAARGHDLQQNAIVGVFLRVLEYYSGVMFLTTNRADLVDDAIASRCLARIDYEVPTADDQRRIWRTLADTAGIELADAEIRKIAERYPHLSGRDVKNLLKLGQMVAQASGDPITAKTIEFVKRFKPTTDQDER